MFEKLITLCWLPSDFRYCHRDPPSAQHFATLRCSGESVDLGTIFRRDETPFASRRVAFHLIFKVLLAQRGCAAHGVYATAHRRSCRDVAAVGPQRPESVHQTAADVPERDRGRGLVGPRRHVEKRQRVDGPRVVCVRHAAVRLVARREQPVRCRAGPSNTMSNSRSGCGGGRVPLAASAEPTTTTTTSGPHAKPRRCIRSGMMCDVAVAGLYGAMRSRPTRLHRGYLHDTLRWRDDYDGAIVVAIYLHFACRAVHRDRDSLTCVSLLATACVHITSRRQHAVAYNWKGVGGQGRREGEVTRTVALSDILRRSLKLLFKIAHIFLCAISLYFAIIILCCFNFIFINQTTTNNVQVEHKV